MDDEGNIELDDLSTSITVGDLDDGDNETLIADEEANYLSGHKFQPKKLKHFLLQIVLIGKGNARQTFMMNVLAEKPLCPVQHVEGSAELNST